MLRERERRVLKIDLWLIAISRVSRQAPLFKKKLICVTPVSNLRRIFQISLSLVGMNGVGVQKRFLTSVYIFGFFSAGKFSKRKSKHSRIKKFDSDGFQNNRKYGKTSWRWFFSRKQQKLGRWSKIETTAGRWNHRTNVTLKTNLDFSFLFLFLLKSR